MDSWNLSARKLEKNGDAAALCRIWSLFPLARLLKYCLTFYCINDNLFACADFIKKKNVIPLKII